MASPLNAPGKYCTDTGTTKRTNHKEKNATLLQPTTTSWINKLRIMHMLQQTRGGWNIHHIEHPYAQSTIKLWQHEWTAHGKLIQEIPLQKSANYHANNDQSIIRKHLQEYLHGHEHNLNATKRIVQIRTNNVPEMDPTKLSTTENETASGIMLKIPPANSNRTPAPGKQYQFATCHKEYSTRKGRLMHQRRPPECKIQPNIPIIRSIHCPNNNCNKIPPTQKQLEKHLNFHRHDKKHNAKTKPTKQRHQNALGQNDQHRCTKNTNKQKTEHAHLQPWNKPMEMPNMRKNWKPQDYINIERRIWRHKEKQKRQAQELQGHDQKPLTATQELRLETHTPKETGTHNRQDTTNQQIPTTETPRNEANATTSDNKTTPAIWGQLNLTKWDQQSDKWKRNISNCQTAGETQRNLTKHLAKARKDTWRPISRKPTTCPYCEKKYPNGILMLHHLGVRHEKYTWPTCTCPTMPPDGRITEIWERLHETQSTQTTQTTQASQSSQPSQNMAIEPEKTWNNALTTQESTSKQNDHSP